GFHVMVGTIFLIVCLFRAMKGQFKPNQHFGFEAAAWYWHFVDVVWLFLFFCIYWWGSGKAPIALHWAELSSPTKLGRCPEGAEGSCAATRPHDPSGPPGHLPNEAGED